MRFLYNKLQTKSNQNKYLIFLLSLLIILLVTGCVHKHLPFPTKDLVPEKNETLIDGTWQSTQRSNFILHIEYGRAYVEEPVHGKNGKVIFSKDAVIIKDITKISPFKYSCNMGDRIGNKISFQNEAEIEVISSSIFKLHRFKNIQLETKEKTLFFEKISLNNEEAFLREFTKRKASPKITFQKEFPEPMMKCSTEQILEMKTMGITNNQIKAACK